MDRIVRTSIILSVLGGCLAACATSYEPVIDTRSVDPARYQSDLQECRAYAAQVDPGGEAAAGAVGSGLVGAALGAVVGAFTGSPGTNAAIGGSTGGILGAASGAGSSAGDQRAIIARCLQGRGYSVLR